MASNTKKTHKKKKISKNSSKNNKNIIEIIKTNEKKYTIILVTFFFLLFCFLGYQTLKIHNNYILAPRTSNNQSKKGINLTGKTITLTKKDIKSDSKGLSSNSLIFNVNNTQNQDINYRIILEEDRDFIQECGCIDKKISFTNIHYSLDGKKVKKVTNDDTVILEDTLAKNSNKIIKLKIWLDENLNSSTEAHFHGQLKIEIIQ